MTGRESQRPSGLQIVSAFVGGLLLSPLLACGGWMGVLMFVVVGFGICGLLCLKAPSDSLRQKEPL